MQQCSLEVRRVESAEADQTGHETGGGEGNDPAHEDETKLFPVDGADVEVHERNTH